MKARELSTLTALAMGLVLSGSAACGAPTDDPRPDPPAVTSALADARALEGELRSAPDAGWDTLWTALAETPLGPDAWLRVGPFPAAVAAWNTTERDVTGYMVPLDASPGPDRFLLVGVPLADCAFCIPGGAAGVIDVHAPRGVPLVYGPITLRGRFHTLDNDPTGALFRLTDAVLR